MIESPAPPRGAVLGGPAIGERFAELTEERDVALRAGWMGGRRLLDLESENATLRSENADLQSERSYLRQCLRVEHGRCRVELCAVCDVLRESDVAGREP